MIVLVLVVVRSCFLREYRGTVGFEYGRTYEFMVLPHIPRRTEVPSRPRLFPLSSTETNIDRRGKVEIVVDGKELRSALECARGTSTETNIDHLRTTNHEFLSKHTMKRKLLQGRL